MDLYDNHEEQIYNAIDFKNKTIEEIDKNSM